MITLYGVTVRVALFMCRQLIREQLRETPERSDRQIGKELGVSHHTVADRRNELESTGQIAQFNTTIGADGKERPRQVERKQPVQEPVMEEPVVEPVVETELEGPALE